MAQASCLMTTLRTIIDAMTEFSLVTAFLIGIAGGVHCYGMCGGITLAMRAASPPDSSHLPFAISYHLGRITSYTAAGAITGSLGWMVSTSSSFGVYFLQIISIVMLILMGLYIGQWYRGLAVLEKLGGHLWRIIQPWSKRFIPFKSPLSAFPYGLIWGWLPCGLVYSTLTWSMASNHPAEGASIMFAFGLGTFPTMLLASMAAHKVMTFYQHSLTRKVISLLLIAYALVLLFKIL